MSHRLFIAIAPPPGIRRALLATMSGIRSARWQSDDQLHLTLRFVGEIESAMADDLAVALASLKHRSFPVEIAGVGHFENKGRPKAVWAGTRHSEALIALHNKVDRACAAAGLPDEHRKYLPHITLARLNSSSGPVDGFLAANAMLALPAFEVSEFVLYESFLGESGARYEPVVRYRLG